FSDPLLEKSVRIDQLHRGGQIAADLIQLSHYWRHLESIGWAAASPRIGGLIGVDRLTTSNDPDCVLRCIVWIDLSLRSIPTISKTRPGKQRLRSPLDRYDHEFGFRVKLAHAAAQRTDGDAPPTVRPIHISECSHCPWWTTCALQLDPGDLSLAIDKSPLDAQEIRALRSLGVLSVTNLVAADMTTLLQEYLPLVPHRPDADQRLLLARHRAEMLANGIMLERIGTEPPQVPRAALEIDFDIETSRDDHVYLWGFLLSKPGSAEPPEYRPFARFGQLGSATECDLAAVALGWLAELLDANPDSIVYHYSEYETRHIARFSQLVAAGKLLAMPQRFCDLFPIIRANYFGVHGIGLKQIALHGAGFHWRDSNPGGLASQSWFEEAVQNPDEQVRAVMAQRLLEYNEDDTRATLALREWLSGGGATN
ncbi:MAG: TM0106 family RecB-like putative nuclease, partial [Propionibacteriaceae bacterium]|nr:TM0106 family RecB-like putative nuclease [Propionibacteriaceae bacterium]